VWTDPIKCKGAPGNDPDCQLDPGHLLWWGPLSRSGCCGNHLAIVVEVGPSNTANNGSGVSTPVTIFGPWPSSLWQRTKGTDDTAFWYPVNYPAI
jgi:hypothetical protein